MFLDPSKVLIILIVALVVLGPDKLPGVARQMGAAWGELRKFRQKLESEVRGTFPDLPSSHQVAQAVRSPLAFLDQLADAHEREQSPEADTEVTTPATLKATPPGPGPAPESSPPVVQTPSAGELAAVEPATGHPPVRRQIGRTRPWSPAQAAEPSIIPDDPSMN
jgi:sec-independent protein translocase protein TatB